VAGPGDLSNKTLGPLEDGEFFDHQIGRQLHIYTAPWTKISTYFCPIIINRLFIVTSVLFIWFNDFTEILKLQLYFKKLWRKFMVWL
jgi:hypothetical protein